MRRIAWLPIPIFIAFFLGIERIDTGVSYEPRLLLPFLNIFFLTCVSLLVAWLAGRSYVTRSSAPVLLLGCGTLAFGLASASAALTAFLVLNTDTTVTIYNTGAFLAGACFLASALLLARRVPSNRIVLRSRPATVVSAYAVVTLLLIVATLAELSGVMPDFFVPGRGPTLVRQVVLGGAVAMFVLSAMLFLILNRRRAPVFVDWYSLALMLIAVGLAGVFSEHVVGGVMSWAGRGAQYLGCVYMFVAVLSIPGGGEEWRIPIDQLLRETEERHQTLVDLCPDAILVHANRKYVFANPAALRLFRARSADQLIGRDVVELIHPDFRDLALRRIEQARRGSSTPLQETQFIRLDGTVADVETTGAPVEFDGVEAIQLVVRDITERKQLERQLREQAASLADANRLKDEFLATLSHELRTPLNAIVGWAQMLAQGGLDDETSRRAIDVILRNAWAQTSLVNDVLDVSRIISGKLRLDLRAVRAADCLEAALDAVGPAAHARGVELRHIADQHVVLLADPNRLQQIFWNLLSNAVKFTAHGGIVHATLRRTGGDVVVTVTDTGMGIAPDFLPRLFERFSQADASTTRHYSGLGLGLALVRHLAELHGGHVSAESEGEGRGATFRVVLPIRAAEAGTGIVADSALPPPLPDMTSAALLAGVKVLVVDDEADARELLAAILHRYGAEVQVAESAREGLEVAVTWNPHVLVSDIGMPGEDGYALLEKVRALAAERGSIIHAVALTAYGRAEDRTRALAAGFAYHLTKPVRPADLASTVAEAAHLS